MSPDDRMRSLAEMKHEIKNLLEERVTSHNIVDNDIKHFQSFISKVTASNVQESYKNFFSLTLDCLNENLEKLDTEAKNKKRMYTEVIKINCELVSHRLIVGLIGRKGWNIKQLEKSSKGRISLINGINYPSSELMFKISVKKQKKLGVVQHLLRKHVQKTEMDQKRVSMLDNAAEMIKLLSDTMFSNL